MWYVFYLFSIAATNQWLNWTILGCIFLTGLFRECPWGWRGGRALTRHHRSRCNRCNRWLCAAAASLSFSLHTSDLQPVDLSPTALTPPPPTTTRALASQVPPGASLDVVSEG